MSSINRISHRVRLRAARNVMCCLLGTVLGGALAQAQTAPATIAQEAFNGGFGQFTPAGRATANNGSAVLAGTFGGADGSMTSAPISTVGFTNITVSFDRASVGLDSGEAGIAEFSVAGGAFAAIESVRAASGRASFMLAAGAANQAQLRLRFRISASNSGETYSVDNVLVQGVAVVQNPDPDPNPNPNPDNPFQRGPTPSTAVLEAARGPFAIAQITVPNPTGFGAGTIYYPTNTTEGPFAAVSVAPGFTERQSAINWWGPRLASHGFVVVTIDTNSTSDSPTSRATQLIASLRQVVALSGTASSPIAGKVDGNRLGVMGHSLGGGGTLIAARDNPTLKAAIPFAPFNSNTNFSTVQVPTLIIACEADGIAPVNEHASPFYNSFAANLEKAYLEVANGSHSCANSGNGNMPLLGKYGVAWYKRFMDNDTRYTQFLCGPLHDADVNGSRISEYRDSCPL
jgi:dienelactone hydrolase